MVVELPAPDEDLRTAEEWAKYISSQSTDGEIVHMAVETDIE